MALFGRSLVLFASLALLAGCSSSDFAVAGSNGDADAGTSGGDGSVPGEDGASGDAAPVDPCAEEPGVAKFCVDVSLAKKEHPGYDATSGATALGIDGKGVLFTYLFDKDPGAPTGPKPSPVAVIQYPPPERVGEEANVDSDLPLTLSGRAPAGEYWIATGFQDAKAPRPADTPTVAGDFVIVPGVTPDGHAIYPKMTLEVGKTARAAAPLRPYRVIDVAVQPTAALNTKAKTVDSIHGDGPILFAIYDGDLYHEKATFLGVDVRPCIKVDVGTFSLPEPVHVKLGTTVDGEHNLLGALFDYSTGTGKDGSNPFPGKGTLLTPIDPASAAPPVPRINISSTSWTGSASAPLDLVNDPYGTAPPADPLTCP